MSRSQVKKSASKWSRNSFKKFSKATLDQETQCDERTPNNSPTGYSSMIFKTHSSFDPSSSEDFSEINDSNSNPDEHTISKEHESSHNNHESVSTSDSSEDDSESESLTSNSSDKNEKEKSEVSRIEFLDKDSIKYYIPPNRSMNLSDVASFYSVENFVHVKLTGMDVYYSTKKSTNFFQDKLYDENSAIILYPSINFGICMPIGLARKELMPEIELNIFDGYASIFIADTVPEELRYCMTQKDYIVYAIQKNFFPYKI